MILCDYGCGEEATHQFKNGKWCCNKNIFQCENIKKKYRKKLITKYGVDNPLKIKEVKKQVKLTCIEKYGVDHPNKSPKIQKKRQITCLKKYGVLNVAQAKEIKEKIEKTCLKKYGVKNPKQSEIEKMKWVERHNFFCTIEDIKIENNKFKVRCKNHKCKNSKEKDGWFEPTYTQLGERARSLESTDGSGGAYLYCSDECKQECPLFNLYSDPLQIQKKIYTEIEYQQFREFVLDRDKYICQYCDKKAEHVHHERPQKLEPFFALDPDYAWSVCKECHYKYGHKDECSTGNLSHIICI